jgi:pyruvate kinase
MLSGETAIGDFPLEAVQVMNNVAMETEGSLPYQKILMEKGLSLEAETEDAISYSACHIAHQLGAAAIVAFTSSGSTAQRVSKYRPGVPVLAITNNEETLRRLKLWWGLQPHLAKGFGDLDEMRAQAVEIAVRTGLAKTGDLLVITAGLPSGAKGTTNLLKVERVG